MWDAIVVGSGIGGLTAAGMLAGVGGKRVLVLEQHTEPGGQTHVFRRDGATWDVGLHYVGDLGSHSILRQMFDYLSGGELEWNRMPRDFERFVYPSIDIAVPSDPQAYRRRLIEQFPQEAAAITRYFRDVRRVGRWATVALAQGLFPAFLDPATRVIAKATGGLATRTTQNYLDEVFSSAQLRALLVSQWPDYGLPPTRSAFAIHALIVTHYFHGGWFPRGGSAKLARTFEKGIERHGGLVRVAQDVQEILVDGGRAVGVRVQDRRGPTPREVTHRAPVVISTVGARITYDRLLATAGETGRRTASERERVGRAGHGLSAVVLYLTLTRSATTIGVEGENHWIYGTFDHNDVSRRTEAMLRGEPEQLYVSFPSLKSGETTAHTAEIISVVDPEAFGRWRDLPTRNRGTEYAALKQTISEGMLRTASTAIPGLAELVEYAELSTPVSVEHYISHPAGEFYGLAATPARYRSRPWGPQTPIAGLYLGGQDVASLGVAGAMLGGAAAAARALGPAGLPSIIAAMRGSGAKTARSAHPPAVPARRGDKRRVMLTTKERLTDTIWRLNFTLDEPVGTYAAGQFVRLHVGDDEWRDYSIAGSDHRRLDLLISTRTGGHGSRYVVAAQPGTETEMELPLGRFTLAPTARKRVFCATGTGLAPFAAMFAELAAAGELAGAELYFGCRTDADDLTTAIPMLPPTVTLCTSRAQPPRGGFRGRVTDALAHAALDVAETDFYLCGSAAMVADCTQVLIDRGARHIYTEPY